MDKTDTPMEERSKGSNVMIAFDLLLQLESSEDISLDQEISHPANWLIKVPTERQRVDLVATPFRQTRSQETKEQLSVRRAAGGQALQERICNTITSIFPEENEPQDSSCRSGSLG